MTRKSEGTHYDRRVDGDNAADSAVWQLELCGRSRAVLEVGCSTGYVSSALRERGNRVVGIEGDPEAAEIARGACDEVVVADLNDPDALAPFTHSSFDVAVFGDVLEHLQDPQHILTQTRRLLRVGGYLVITIPNVAHWSLRLLLLNGRFDYQDRGLLDRTHLRFFTRDSFSHLLQQAGYQVHLVRALRNPFPGWNRLGDSILERPPFAARAWLRSVFRRPDSEAFQYVFIASPSPTVPDDVRSAWECLASRLDVQERPPQRSLRVKVIRTIMSLGRGH